MTSTSSPAASLSRRGFGGLLGASALLTLAGCGGGPGSGSGGGSGPVELRFSWWGNEARAEATKKAIEAFRAKAGNIAVSGESTDFNAYFDRLATSVAANDAPDVITLGGAYPREYGDRGALLDLSKVSAQLPLGRIDPGALSNGEFGGVQYGVPTGVNTFAVVADPTVFEAAGVPMPDDTTWSWDDFARIAEEISAKSPEGTFGSPDPTRAETLDLFSFQRGEGLYTEDGKVAVTEGTLADWWAMTVAMSASGATPSASQTAELAGQPSPEQTLVGRGLAGLQPDWSNQLTALRIASGRPLVLLRAPGESTGKQKAMWLQASQLYTISARSEHPEQAAQLIDFLVNSPEAGRFILTDRGIPANPEVLAAITPGLDENQKAQADFIAAVSGEVRPELIIGPTGSTDTAGILQRLNAEVLFGRQTPEQAGAAFVDQVSAAIA